MTISPFRVPKACRAPLAYRGGRALMAIRETMAIGDRRGLPVLQELLEAKAPWAIQGKMAATVTMAISGRRGQQGQRGRKAFRVL